MQTFREVCGSTVQKAIPRMSFASGSVSPEKQLGDRFGEGLHTPTSFPS